MTITGLGFFDVGSDGLLNDHEVGLWTNDGTLLANVTLDNTANIVSSTSVLGQWREVDIAPLALVPGDYVLGSFFRDVFGPTPEDDAVWLDTPVSIPGIS